MASKGSGPLAGRGRAQVSGRGRVRGNWGQCPRGRLAKGVNQGPRGGGQEKVDRVWLTEVGGMVVGGRNESRPVDGCRLPCHIMITTVCDTQRQSLDTDLVTQLQFGRYDGNT